MCEQLIQLQHVRLSLNLRYRAAVALFSRMASLSICTLATSVSSRYRKASHGRHSGKASEAGSREKYSYDC